MPHPELVAHDQQTRRDVISAALDVNFAPVQRGKLALHLGAARYYAEAGVK